MKKLLIIFLLGFIANSAIAYSYEEEFVLIPKYAGWCESFTLFTQIQLENKTPKKEAFLNYVFKVVGGDTTTKACIQVMINYINKFKENPSKQDILNSSKTLGNCTFIFSLVNMQKRKNFPEGLAFIRNLIAVQANRGNQTTVEFLTTCQELIRVVKNDTVWQHTTS